MSWAGLEAPSADPCSSDAPGSFVHGNGEGLPEFWRQVAGAGVGWRVGGEGLRRGGV